MANCRYSVATGFVTVPTLNRNLSPLAAEGTNHALAIGVISFLACKQADLKLLTAILTQISALRLSPKGYPSRSLASMCG